MLAPSGPFPSDRSSQERSLLEQGGSLEALNYARAADETTRRNWRATANKLVASLGAGWIERSTEVALQSDFLNVVFGQLLGYSGSLAGRTPFTLSASVTTEVDATEADATLGWFTAPGIGRTRAVIELKDARTNLDKRQLSRRDRLTPVDQAFLYATKFAGCEWVIVSNFLELRLYATRHGQAIYERFHILELTDDERLIEFVSLLLPEALIGSGPESEGYLQELLVERPLTRERAITEEFYGRYAAKRNRLLNHLFEHHPNEDPSALIGAAQKLFDRVLFIAFAEDRPLLPHGILRRTADVALQSRSRSGTKVWEELKELFRDIDVGREDLAPAIPAYNGGLFAHDSLLDDRLAIVDEIALELVALGDYDYRRTIDVEILGNVFEQSIADLEHLREARSLDVHAVDADSGGLVDTRRSLGVFYTPRWITGYIVNATIGRLAESLEPSRDQLEHITVLDPACGSGAFLAQAYRYLVELAEAAIPEVLPAEQRGLLDAQPVLQPSRYLSGLYGIDVMPEAVEIVRLSLWLASASPLERLQHLDRIRVGNTLAAVDGSSPIRALFPEERPKEGFHAVVGNPPWGAKLDFALDPTLTLAVGQYDSYELFVERALRDTVREGGLFGFVVPDRFLRPEGERLRRWLFDRFQVLEVIKLGEGVFENVFRAAVVLIVRKASAGQEDELRTLSVSKEDRTVLEETGPAYLHALMEERGGTISRSRVLEDESYGIPLGATDEDLSIMSRMRENARPWVGSNGCFEPHGRGVELGADGFVIRCNACFEWQVGPRRRSMKEGGGYKAKSCAFCGATIEEGEWEQAATIVTTDSPGDSQSFPGDAWSRLYTGEDISRYHLRDAHWIRTGVPNINYKDESLYEPPKILIRQAGVGVNVAVDETSAYCLQSAYVYRVKQTLDASPYFFLACLASRTMLFYFHRRTNQTEWQSFPKLVHKTLHQLPLPDPSAVDRSLHDRIAQLAKSRMKQTAHVAHDLDLEIERSVMDAYGLAPQQRQRISRTLRSVQRLRVVREMFPTEDDGGTARLV